MIKEGQSPDAFSAITQQLAEVERRDWELWIIVSVAGALVTAGLLALIIPAAFLKQEDVHFQITVSRQLVIGLLVLLGLLNGYLVIPVELRSDTPYDTTRTQKCLRFGQLFSPMTSFTKCP